MKSKSVRNTRIVFPHSLHEDLLIRFPKYIDNIAYKNMDTSYHLYFTKKSEAKIILRSRIVRVCSIIELFAKNDLNKIIKKHYKILSCKNPGFKPLIPAKNVLRLKIAEISLSSNRTMRYLLRLRSFENVEINILDWSNLSSMCFRFLDKMPVLMQRNKVNTATFRASNSFNLEDFTSFLRRWKNINFKFRGTWTFSSKRVYTHMKSNIVSIELSADTNRLFEFPNLKELKVNFERMYSPTVTYDVFSQENFAYIQNLDINIFCDGNRIKQFWDSLRLPRHLKILKLMMRQANIAQVILKISQPSKFANLYFLERIKLDFCTRNISPGFQNDLIQDFNENLISLKSLEYSSHNLYEPIQIIHFFQNSYFFALENFQFSSLCFEGKYTKIEPFFSYFLTNLTLGNGILPICLADIIRPSNFPNLKFLTLYKLQAENKKELEKYFELINCYYAIDGHISVNVDEQKSLYFARLLLKFLRDNLKKSFWNLFFNITYNVDLIRLDIENVIEFLSFSKMKANFEGPSFMYGLHQNRKMPKIEYYKEGDQYFSLEDILHNEDRNSDDMET